MNKSFPDEQNHAEKSPKIHADYFIDDRNIGGFIGWGKIYQLLTNEVPYRKSSKSKRGFWGLFK